MVSDAEVQRTLHVVTSLAEGKILKLPTGERIAMDEEMAIGYVITNSLGKEGIAAMATMDLAGLNKLLTNHKIFSVD
jgi:hypothetical protein